MSCLISLTSSPERRDVLLDLVDIVVGDLALVALALLLRDVAPDDEAKDVHVLLVGAATVLGKHSVTTRVCKFYDDYDEKLCDWLAVSWGFN